MTTRPPLPILILAAGQSARMRGADKLAEPVAGVALLRRQALHALTLSDAVFVALPSDPAPRARLLDGLPVTLWPIPSAAEGMSATLRDAVALLPICARFMVLLADLPLLLPEDLGAVASAVAAHPEALIWRGATADGKPGHPIIFDASLRPAFAMLRGDGGGEALVKPLVHRTHLVRLPGQRARRDLDTPEDWAMFRAETGL